MASFNAYNFLDEAPEAIAAADGGPVASTIEDVVKMWANSQLTAVFFVCTTEE